MHAIYSFSQLLKEVAGLEFEHGSAEAPGAASAMRYYVTCMQCDELAGRSTASEVPALVQVFS